MEEVAGTFFIKLHRLYPAEDLAKDIEHDLLEHEVRSTQEYLK